jgi:preprotein translocase subunit SecG
MQTILTVIQVFLSLGLIGLILIQHGKGADAGAAFGSGASSTVFGSRGSGSFLTRLTAIMATIFFLTSMALAYYATKGSEPETIMSGVDESTIILPAPVGPASDIPAIPGSAEGGAAEPQGDIPSDVPAARIPADAEPKEQVVVEDPAAVEDAKEGAADDGATEPTREGQPDEAPQPSGGAEEQNKQ